MTTPPKQEYKFGGGGGEREGLEQNIGERYTRESENIIWGLLKSCSNLSQGGRPLGSLLGWAWIQSRPMINRTKVHSIIARITPGVSHCKLYPIKKTNKLGVQVPKNLGVFANKPPQHSNQINYSNVSYTNCENS